MTIFYILALLLLSTHILVLSIYFPAFPLSFLFFFFSKSVCGYIKMQCSTHLCDYFELNVDDSSYSSSWPNNLNHVSFPLSFLFSRFIDLEVRCCTPLCYVSLIIFLSRLNHDKIELSSTHLPCFNPFNSPTKPLGINVGHLLDQVSKFYQSLKF